MLIRRKEGHCLPLSSTLELPLHDCSGHCLLELLFYGSQQVLLGCQALKILVISSTSPYLLVAPSTTTSLVMVSPTIL